MVLREVLDGCGSMNAPAGSGGPGLRWTVRVFVSVAAVVAVGTAALVTRRYLSDSGLIPFGTGASLVNERRAQVALAIAVTSVVVVALVAVLLGRRLRDVANLVTSGVAIVLSVGALIAYPHAVNARLVVLDPSTGHEDWSIDARAEWIAGVTSQTGNQVVLSGTDDADHNCEGWRSVRVTIDLVRREVVTVSVQPRSFRPTDAKPARPVEPDPRRFRIEQGTPVRRCSS